MNPPTADPQTVLAPRNALRERGHLDRVEMRADVSQAGVIPGVSWPPYICARPSTASGPRHARLPPSQHPAGVGRARDRRWCCGYPAAQNEQWCLEAKSASTWGWGGTSDITSAWASNSGQGTDAVDGSPLAAKSAQAARMAAASDSRFGIVLMFVEIPNGSLIYAILGLVIFAGLTAFDFQRLRPTQDIRAAPLLAASIFLDILNVFLLPLLSLSAGTSRWRPHERNFQTTPIT